MGVADMVIIFDEVENGVNDDKIEVDAIDVALIIALKVIAVDEVIDDVAEIVGVIVTELDGEIVGENDPRTDSVGTTVLEVVTQGLIVVSIDLLAELVEIID